MLIACTSPYCQLLNVDLNKLAVIYIVSCCFSFLHRHHFYDNQLNFNIQKIRAYKQICTHQPGCHFVCKVFFKSNYYIIFNLSNVTGLAYPWHRLDSGDEWIYVRGSTNFGFKRHSQKTDYYAVFLRVKKIPLTKNLRMYVQQ